MVLLQITKLRQDGQYPRIKIKTEPCEGEQYVRICQPQVNSNFTLLFSSCDASNMVVVEHLWTELMYTIRSCSAYAWPI